MLIESRFSKVTIIILLLLILYVLCKYPRTRFKKLSKLRKYRLNLINKFRISNLWDEIHNIFFLLIYFFGITSLIFFFRLLNKEKILDLKYYFLIIHNFIVKSELIDIFYVFLIYTSLVIIYLILMIKIIKYLKFQVIKRHLYFMRFDLYKSDLFFGFIYKIVLIGPFSIESRIYTSIESAYRFILNLLKIKKNYGPNYDQLSYKEQTEICLKSPVDPDCLLIKYRLLYKIIPFILKNIHHFLSIIIITYDICYNNFTITKIFYILPWIFFYDLYVRTSIFLDNLHLPYDEKFCDIVYATSIEILDKNNIILNGEIRDYNTFKHLYHTYVKRNFVKDHEDLFH